MGKRSEDSWFMDGIHRRNFRQDHGGGPEEMPHRKSKGKKSKPRKGCPENNNKQHVYVNVSQKKHEFYPMNNGQYVLTSWPYVEVKCCGCGHVKNRIWDWKNCERKVVDKIPRWYWQF